jgi:hypothetical protein
MYAVGKYSFAKYRIVWKFMASKIEAAVISGFKTPFTKKPLVSTKTTAFFASDSREEAHYLCSILNSEIVNAFIKSFSAAGRGFGTPSVMDHIRIPKFSPHNKIHKKLAELSLKAHDRVKNSQSIEDIEKEINEVVKGLWNIK